MSGEPVTSGICNTDVEEAKQLAVDLVAVVIRNECNIATLLTALAIMAEMHLEFCRRHARAQSLDCVGTA